MKKTILTLTTLIFLSLTALTQAEANSPLMITEVMPNPAGSDTDYEWIEITNYSNAVIPASNWQINNKQLPDIHIGPDEIVVLARNKSKFYERYSSFVRVEELDLALPNSGGLLTITDSSDSFMFEYPTSAEEISFELLSGGCNAITKHPTSNSVGQTNTSCFDPTPTATPQLQEYSNKIIINRINANPTEGEEWIELKNLDSIPVNLDSWIIEDESSKKYTLSNINLDPLEVIKIYPTNVSLNNAGDTIYLFTPTSQQVDVFSYNNTDNDQIWGDIDTIVTSETEQIKEEVKNTSNNAETNEANTIEYAIPKLYKIGDY